jgi:multidrug efflux system outer membrane protein
VAKGTGWGMMRRETLRKLLGVFALLFLVFALARCTVGPKYRQPDIPMPKNWRVPAETSGSLANVRWWDVFKDTTLQSLIRTALAENTDLRTAAVNVMEAQAQVGITRAQQLPQIQASGNIQRQKVSAQGRFPFPPGLSSQFNDLLFSGGASYIVDFWGQYRSATEESRQLLLATEEGRRYVTMTVVSSVAQAYFLLRTLDQELEITRQTVVSFQNSLQLTQDLYRYGVASELSVRQAETLLKAAQANIPALERQIAQQENALSILLGHNPEAIPRGAALTQQALPPAVPAGLPSELLVRRPDIRQASDQLAATYAAIGVAKAQFFPQFQLTGSGGTESTKLLQLGSIPSLVFNLAGGLTAPIFEGGRLRNNLKLTKTQQQAAVINYQSVVQQAFREVDDALVAYQKNQEQASAEESLVAAASSALDLANIRYSGGVASYLDVLDSERQLYSAQLSLAQTRGAILTSLVQLYQALGGGWQQ